MKQVSAYEPEVLAQLTGFEQFLILNKHRLIWVSFFVALLLPILVFGLGGPQHYRIKPQTPRMQVAHALGLALYSYANDHDRKYPQGNSSTEIFQQLVDQQYVSDPAIFYFPIAGKTKATSNKLKPENVCWDVTNVESTDDPGSLPLIFSTGFKVDYAANGKAQLLPTGDPNGIAVFYVDNSAKFISSKRDGGLVIEPTFDPKGKTYRQLTPEGPLP